MDRPLTSKPRGICRYYNVPRGCFAGDRCKFLHAEHPGPGDLTPYDKAKRCRYYAQGFCKRGDACWFLHVPDSSSEPPRHEDDEACSICFEKPSTYALLSGCSHVFCTTCIKQWRDPQNKPAGVLDSGNTKKCPMCRTPSKFITPSSRFWKGGTLEKLAVIQAYRDSMARVPCRYFQKNKDKPMCPYGKDCFYQHLKDDGTPCVFKDGVDICMRRYRQSLFQRRGLSFPDMHLMPLSISDLNFIIPVAGRSPQESHSQNGANPTIREIRATARSLELLHEAISDLPFAAETGRVGLGRRTTGRGAARREDEFTDFLVMASLNRIHAANHEEGQPPPLEAIGTPARSPSPAHRRRPRPRVLVNDPYGSDSSTSSMPRIQSRSATEDEDDDQWTDDDDDQWTDDDNDVELRAMMGLFASRREEPTPAAEHPEPDGELPPLEPIDGSESDDGSEDGPFVTDGRGRAVWTGPGEENKRDRSSERDGDGGGQAGSGGRSILGWFNTLF